MLTLENITIQEIIEDYLVRQPIAKLVPIPHHCGFIFENPKSVPLKKRPKDTRELIVVYFGKALDVTSEYDGKRRVLMRTHLPFYQTTSSSSTNLELAWLKGTWLPCFGLSPHDHIFKLSGLKSAQGAVGKWPAFLAQQKNQQDRLHQRDKRYNPLYTMDVIKFKNNKGDVIDEYLFPNGWVSLSMLGITPNQCGYRGWILE